MMTLQIITLRVGLAFLICLCEAQSVGVAQSRPRTGGTGPEQNKALVRRWIEEGFNKGDLKVVDETFVEDFTVNGLKVGCGGLKQSMGRHLTAFPDLHVVIDVIIAEGDKVGIWYTARGTQRGDYEGVPPTGKQVSWVGVDLLRVEGGKIVEGRFVDDSLGLLRQLGAAPAPPPIHE